MWVKLDYFPTNKSKLISDYVLAECLIGLHQGDRVLVAADFTRTVQLPRTTPKFILRCHQGDKLFEVILRKMIFMDKNQLTELGWKYGFTTRDRGNGQTYGGQSYNANLMLKKIDRLNQKRWEREKKANMQKKLKDTGRKRAISVS